MSDKVRARFLTALFCLLSALCTCGRSSAQLLIPDILTSHFDRQSSFGENGSGTDSILSNAPDSLAQSDHVEAGASEDSTLHTNRRGVGVIDDLNDKAAVLEIQSKLGERTSSPLFGVRELWFTGIIDSSESRTTIFSHESMNYMSGYVSWRLRSHSSILLESESSRYRFTGSSSVVDGVFDIFPTDPMIYLDTDLARNSLVWTSPSTRRLQLGLSIGDQRTIGNISLLAPDNPAKIIVPINEEGLVVSEADRIRLSPRYSFAGFLQKSSRSADGSVSRESGTDIGSSQTRHDSSSDGLAFRIQQSKGQSLQLFYERSFDNWAVTGTVDSAEDIGLPIDYVVGLGFHASYDIDESFTGVNWTKVGANNRRLDFQYRWIELNGQENYGYQGDVFIIQVGKSSQQTQDDLRGHLLMAIYQIPIGRCVLALTASQLIPIVSHSSGKIGSSSGGTPGQPRTSSGGSTLSFVFSYAL